ncbi:MAG: DUF4956 domain-containing protein, partial [Pseudomonadales bacterium]|nr:DUF4956 domain-containing protein [Pseudomonadales bacterium]
GLSYSQSFTLTILYVTVIVAVVMMVIGGSLARAFALVGALSIIRFRTVIKDTKDTAYVFMALAVGMAAGTSNYFLAAASTLILSVLALSVHHFNYGALYKSDFILRFLMDREGQAEDYLKVLDQFARVHRLLHIEGTGDPALNRFTLDLSLKEDLNPQDLLSAIQALDGISEAVIIASKNDVDY